MLNDVMMPKLSDSMTEGKIVRWVKAVGERVEPGDILAVLEAEGTGVDLPAFFSGVIAAIDSVAGETVPVGGVIARIEVGNGESVAVEEQHPCRTEKLNATRAVMAHQLCASWQNVPHFSVTVEIDMGQGEELCRVYRSEGERYSVTDLIIKGCACALAKFPQINASLVGEEVCFHREVNIGLSMNLQHGAVVPVLRGCTGMTVRDIARTSRKLLEKARKGRLTDEEMTGATFTVDNLGMYGVNDYLAIVRVPEVAILALGAILNAPVVADGRVVAGRIMRATLCGDHRLLDGADAGMFLAELKRQLEHPSSLLVGCL